MAKLVIHVGSFTAQGRRSNNEDCFFADPQKRVYLVADGMGGQDCGEKASGLAADIIPRAIETHLAEHADPRDAVRQALSEANQAIIHAGQQQASGRRMGTTAVLAVEQDNQVYVAGLGDSRAYLIRGGRVEQLTTDHTWADVLERNGTLTADQARQSPWRNVLYKFLGCVEMTDGADVYPFAPAAGDRLVLASDGLTNHITPEDLRDGALHYSTVQEWAKQLVQMALDRGSRDNVTCVVVAFDEE
jgi:protein phosphatase